jgi:hypothetical protein
MKSRSEDTRSYELLVANARNMPTPAPGAHSYTNHLIKALDELRREHGSFSTFDLNQRISKLRKFDGSSHLTNRLNGPYHRHIRFARPAPKHQNLNPRVARNGGNLTLRVGFRERNTLSETEVDKLAREISKLSATADLGICEIEWLRFDPYQESVQFKKLVRAVGLAHVFSNAKLRFREKKARKRKADAEALTNGNRTPKRRQSEPLEAEMKIEKPAKSWSYPSPREDMPS